MAEVVKWGKREARINDIAPGIIVTPLAIDEFNGLRGKFYKSMFAKCPLARPGTADEAANAAELLMSYKGASITGATFLIDDGATSNYYYGPLGPRKKAQIKVSEFSFAFANSEERPRQAGVMDFTGSCLPGSLIVPALVIQNCEGILHLGNLLLNNIPLLLHQCQTFIDSIVALHAPIHEGFNFFDWQTGFFRHSMMDSH